PSCASSPPSLHDALPISLLEKVFEFHPLAVEDTLSPRTRVKLEEYDRYVFVVMAGVQFDQATPDPFDLQTSNLYFFLGKNRGWRDRKSTRLNSSHVAISY